MSKKTLILIINVFVFILIVMGVVYYFLNRQASAPAGNTSPSETSPVTVTPITPVTVTPAPITPPPTKDAQLPVSGIDNTTISVKNFYTNPQTNVFDRENDAVIKDSADFSLQYYTVDKSFLISIVGSDLQASRDAGEAELLKSLGVSKDVACKLRVSVTVPASVSGNASGVDYGLSWCPNGKHMPTNAGPLQY